MLGVVSNSFGRADALAEAIEVFLASEVEFVVHCGDVGGRHVLDVLARVGGGFVWGDRDQFDRLGLMRHGQSLNLACYGWLGDFEFADKRFVVVHGNDKKVVRRLVDEQQYDYLLFGHSESAEDRTVGKMRIINPGSLHGAKARSAMLLDPDSGRTRLLAL